MSRQSQFVSQPAGKEGFSVIDAIRESRFASLTRQFCKFLGLSAGTPQIGYPLLAFAGKLGKVLSRLKRTLRQIGMPESFKELMVQVEAGSADAQNRLVHQFGDALIQAVRRRM